MNRGYGDETINRTITIRKSGRSEKGGEIDMSEFWAAWDSFIIRASIYFVILIALTVLYGEFRPDLLRSDNPKPPPWKRYAMLACISVIPFFRFFIAVMIVLIMFSAPKGGFKNKEQESEDGNDEQK